MRFVAYVVVSGALAISAAGPASAGCYKDCADDVVRPAYIKAGYYDAPRYLPAPYWGPVYFTGHEAVSYFRPFYRSYSWRSGKRYRYDPGPYISHRANFGYGGCRVAYLWFDSTLQLTSNC